MSDRPAGERDATQRAALQEIAAALMAVVERLRTRAAASREFMRLTDRARSIAGQARQVSTSKWGVTENAAALAKELAKFAGEVTAASARATSETSGNVAVANTLVAQAQRIQDIGACVLPQPTAIRAELEPLEATLSTLRDRMRHGDTVARDADALARRAAILAENAVKLGSGGRAVENAAMEIQRSLCAFVEDAVSISVRISDASAGLSDAAAGIARGATQVLGGGVQPSVGRAWQQGVIVWGQ